MKNQLQWPFTAQRFGTFTTLVLGEAARHVKGDPGVKHAASGAHNVQMPFGRGSRTHRLLREMTILLL
ncbi:hypothetical protein BN439_0376 [Erwinia amylovora Ea644]|uniref:hypothetical protein n=1 Tax=Erwinia amylovora TaxID=552 RepID=UPI0002C8B970|nr:hypothetical protein [Erwinia amylovora]CCP01467.1 hypothetical protein BN439_0376 [Erwinia amylovora Ea644]CCP05462.1 hypothetical protein BN440_0409 [Erwinia amylovora MR1]